MPVVEVLVAVDERQSSAPGDLAHRESGAEQDGAAATDHERALPGAQERQERVPEADADGSHFGRATHPGDGVARTAHRAGLNVAQVARSERRDEAASAQRRRHAVAALFQAL